MNKDEHIRRCEKAAETFEQMADRADRNPIFQRRGWDGSGHRASAERAKASAERLRSGK